MIDPVQFPSPAGRLGERLAAYGERVDADLERFNIEQRRIARRRGLYAVLGAMIVVGIGIWGFGEETNTRNGPAATAALPQRGTASPVGSPPNATVMVVIRPG